MRYELEQPLVWRRDRLPTITVQADVRPALPQSATVAARAQDRRLGQPAAGLRVEVGGTVEESAKGTRPITAVVPIMLFVMSPS